MAGGTITITNVGVFGVDTGTPILNPGETGILAFGAVRRMPWVVGRATIEPRWVTQLAVSFDHRVVDGQQGSQFLADVAAVLADPGDGAALERSVVVLPGSVRRPVPVPVTGGVVMQTRPAGRLPTPAEACLA